MQCSAVQCDVVRSICVVTLIWCQAVGVVWCHMQHRTVGSCADTGIYAELKRGSQVGPGRANSLPKKKTHINRRHFSEKERMNILDHELFIPHTSVEVGYDVTHLNNVKTVC